MDDKEWVLTQVKRRYKELKTKRDGYTQSQLIAYAVRERKRICKAHPDVGRDTTRFKGKYCRLRGTANIENIPPGEDKIRRFVKELEEDGTIKFYDLKPPKKSRRKKRKNDHGGGRGNRRIMIPTESGEKIRRRRDSASITLIGLETKVKKFREMELDKIGISELSEYVTLKNKIFRFPVEYANDVKSKTLYAFFEFIRNDVAAACADIDRKIAADRKKHDARKALDVLASNNEFLYKATTKIELGRDDLSFSKHVIVVRELK